MQYAEHSTGNKAEIYWNTLAYASTQKGGRTKSRVPVLVTREGEGLSASCLSLGIQKAQETTKRIDKPRDCIAGNQAKRSVQGQQAPVEEQLTDASALHSSTIGRWGWGGDGGGGCRIDPHTQPAVLVPQQAVAAQSKIC